MGRVPTLKPSASSAGKSSPLSMNEIEHQPLLVVEQVGLAAFDDLVRNVQQGRDNLQARLVKAALLA